MIVAGFHPVAAALGDVGGRRDLGRAGAVGPDICAANGSCDFVPGCALQTQPDSAGWRLTCAAVMIDSC